MLELEPHCRAVAVKNVSINEPFFAGHWPGLPIMPGVLILESLAQAAGILIAASIDSAAERVALIASIDGSSSAARSCPATSFGSKCAVSDIKNSSACVKGQAKVGESLAAEAQFRFVILDAASRRRARPSAVCLHVIALPRRPHRSAVAGRIGRSS